MFFGMSMRINPFLEFAWAGWRPNPVRGFPRTSPTDLKVEAYCHKESNDCDSTGSTAVAGKGRNTTVRAPISLAWAAESSKAKCGEPACHPLAGYNEKLSTGPTKKLVEDWKRKTQPKLKDHTDDRGHTRHQSPPALEDEAAAAFPRKRGTKHAGFKKEKYE